MGEWWHYYCTVNAVVDGLFRCLVSAAMVVHNSTALLACYIQTATKTTTKAAHNYTTRERERYCGRIFGERKIAKTSKHASSCACCFWH